MITNNPRGVNRLMPLRYPRFFLFLMILLLPGVVFFTQPRQAHAARPEFPAPKWLDHVSVSNQMVINGLPSSVQYFEAYRKVEDLLDYYRKRWNDGGAGKPAYREIEVPPWHIIAKLDGQFLYTVQAQENGAFSIRGYLAIADLKSAEKSNRISSETPMMRGSRILNHSTSIDPGKKGQILMLMNSFSITGNAEYYRDYFQERGWAKLVDMENERAQILSFKKYGRETHLVISHIDSETQIVMNIVETD